MMTTKSKSMTIAFAVATVWMGSGIAQADPMASAVHMTGTLSPNAPRVGDNSLDLTVVDASGAPVSGLKFSTTVAMTSMDMGTAHPAVKDMGNGHYRATVSFGMAGPWRVVLRTGGSKAALDFDAGSSSAWKSPPITLIVASKSTSPSEKSGSSMPGMDMSGMSKTPVTDTPSTAPSMPTQGMSGMSMETTPKYPFPGYGPNGPPSQDSNDMAGMSEANMDMKPLKMPQLQEEGTYVVTGHENWKVRTGFGKNSGMVGMMSQMMVGGSGMEGMKMPPMKMGFDEPNYTEDLNDTEAETSPVTTDSMPGMKMSPSGTSSSTGTPLKITGAIASPKSGDNSFTVTVLDASGTPVTGAKITTSVAMTSMDMGTSHPPIKELGGGKYQGTVTFGMSGPWRVTVTVRPTHGGPPQKKAFDFNAK